MGYGSIIAIDKRPEALENAKQFGATETYLPEEIPALIRQKETPVYGESLRPWFSDR